MDQELFDFYRKLVGVKSALLPNEAQLAPKEVEFMACCCALHASGVDINNFSLLCDYFVTTRRMFKRRTDVSLYKNKLATKRWVRGGLGRFLLPDELTTAVRNGDKFEFVLRITYPKGS